MKQNPITTFDAGFFKEAEALGMDVHFLKGLVAENNEAVQKWSAAFDEIEQQTGDKHFRFKVAGELAELLKDRPTTPMQKQANEMLQQILQWAQENPELTGGGIGGLLGLLLGHSAGHPLMGLMMGGLGGAGLGHYGKLQNWWGGGAAPSPTPSGSAVGDDVAAAVEEESNGGPQPSQPVAGQPEVASDPDADALVTGVVPDPREANADQTVLERLNKGLITEQDFAAYNQARKKIDLLASQAGNRREANAMNQQIDRSWWLNPGGNASRVFDENVATPLRNAGQLATDTVNNMVDATGDAANAAGRAVGGAAAATGRAVGNAVGTAGRAVQSGVQTARELPGVIQDDVANSINPVQQPVRQAPPQVRPPLAPNIKPVVPPVPNNRPVVPPQAPGTNRFAPSFQR